MFPDLFSLRLSSLNTWRVQCRRRSHTQCNTAIGSTTTLSRQVFKACHTSRASKKFSSTAKTPTSTKRTFLRVRKEYEMQDKHFSNDLQGRQNLYHLHPIITAIKPSKGAMQDTPLTNHEILKRKTRKQTRNQKLNQHQKKYHTQWKQHYNISVDTPKDVNEDKGVSSFLRAHDSTRSGYEDEGRNSQ